MSDEEIYQQIGEIVRKFTLFQCAECAQAVKQWLKENNITGTLLKITPAYGGLFMVSERWKAGSEAITQNGLHYAIEVRGRVFDNLSTFGLPRNEWIKGFDCPGSTFKIEEVEQF